ncbi:uncharacterized protein BT62DRAFT_922375 [Guyanagaster necrorhizus]|uniref:Uncharacterized protein n=1 Tax=Guyanagaster necrorhizus TaxID=856835 RepID=A0A9P7VLX6_9AGAR|nr:uncharacterized protein BT62DRAFT_922375 [Guyanagaster necrorhizus MCA 3950]KAG7442945.1 hypothetical protein BT62DRAFT_922375 [Guyanagaster necrorhizus MCA 3950]
MTHYNLQSQQPTAISMVPVIAEIDSPLLDVPGLGTNHNLDDLRKHGIPIADYQKGWWLIQEQLQIIQEAEKNLTQEQHDILRRQHLHWEQSEMYSPMNGSSSAIAKEKFADHNQEINDPELDIRV